MMKIVRCIIIEDNIVEQKILETHLKRLPHIEIVEIFSNPIDAIPTLHSNEIDLLFSDIQLPEINGIELIRTLANPPKIIITTSFTGYALDAFEVGAADYLVKPYTFERLLKAISRATDTNPKPILPTEDAYIFLKAGRDLLKFFVRKIDYFEAYGSFTKVYIEGKNTTLSESITNIQDKMPFNTFVRVHKSYLVSREKITGISTKNVLLDKIKIPLGISYRVEVEKTLGSN
jgi:DNA-binding LytR/AlgR family response regulator